MMNRGHKVIRLYILNTLNLNKKQKIEGIRRKKSITIIEKLSH